MATIILQLDPGRLSNPDMDIRYVLPELLVERSAGRLVDDGYDYAGDGTAACLLLFFRTDDVGGAVPVVVEVLNSERVLDNDLSGVAVGVEDERGLRVVYPPDFCGTFHRAADR